MSKKTFNPAEWLAAAPSQPAQISNFSMSPLSQSDIETIVQRVKTLAPTLLQIMPIGAIWVLLSLMLWARAGEITITV